MKSEEIYFQNLNNIYDVIQIMNSCQEIGKDSINILDHISIIQKYIKNEYLGREQAIDIYKKFNIENSEYLLGMNFYLLFYPNNCVNLELSSNEVIIENLSLQLLYFCFKEYLVAVVPNKIHVPLVEFLKHSLLFQPLHS